jgi:hypothetical protein
MPRTQSGRYGHGHGHGHGPAGPAAALSTAVASCGGRGLCATNTFNCNATTLYVNPRLLELLGGGGGGVSRILSRIVVGSCLPSQSAGGRRPAADCAREARGRRMHRRLLLLPLLLLALPALLLALLLLALLAVAALSRLHEHAPGVSELAGECATWCVTRPGLVPLPGLVLHTVQCASEGGSVRPPP